MHWSRPGIGFTASPRIDMTSVNASKSLALASKGLALISTLLIIAAPANGQRRSLTHGAEKRGYIVYTPASYHADSQKTYPVVMNFHGGGMTMAEQMLYSRMNVTADAHNFIVVYPQGINQDWNVGFGMSYQEGTDDIGFVEALLDQLSKDYRIATDRIYAAGLSRGGFFCHRIAAELSHRFAAVAAVGALLPQPVELQQRPRANPVPIGVMLVHGTADKIVAYDGKSGGYLSAHESFAYWTKRNKIAATVAATRRIDVDPGDGTYITDLRTTGGPATVALITVHDGGHAWVGADAFNVGLPLGKTSKDADLNEMIWRFFEGHRR